MYDPSDLPDWSDVSDLSDLSNVWIHAALGCWWSTTVRRVDYLELRAVCIVKIFFPQFCKIIFNFMKLNLPDFKTNARCYRRAFFPIFVEQFPSLVELTFPDDALNPFRTAVPFSGQTTWNLTGLPPQRDWGSERVHFSHTYVFVNYISYTETFSRMTGSYFTNKYGNSGGGEKAVIYIIQGISTSYVWMIYRQLVGHVAGRGPSDLYDLLL